MAGKYKAVSTAEKRAEYELLGKPWPVCDCHGVGVRWRKDGGCRAGGGFECEERKRKQKREKRVNDPEWAERTNKRQREKYANDSEYAERVRKREREKRVNDPEWAERDRERKREEYHDKYANDPEWVERERERGRVRSRVENKTPEQAERRREYHRGWAQGWRQTQKGRESTDRNNWNRRIRELKAEQPIAVQQLAETTGEIQRLEREVQCLS